MAQTTTTSVPVRLADVQPPPGWIAAWERKKKNNLTVHWMVEFIAEAVGHQVFTIILALILMLEFDSLEYSFIHTLELVQLPLTFWVILRSLPTLAVRPSY